MKKLIVPILAITAFVGLSACRTDVQETREPSTHSSTTTTTDQSTIQRPADSTTTTETRSSN